MPSRAIVAVVLAVAIAGCFGGGPAADVGTADDAPNGNATNDMETTADAETTSTPGEGPDTSPPVMGQGDSISTTVNGTPEDVRYFPDNDTIRFVAAWRHSNHEAVERGAPPEREPVYEYVTVEHWVGFHAPSVGAEAVSRAVRERLGEEVPGVSVAMRGSDGDHRLVAKRTTLLNRDGKVVSEANVSAARLASVTPRSVTVTVSLPDREFTRTYTVGVESETLQQQ